MLLILFTIACRNFSKDVTAEPGINMGFGDSVDGPDAPIDTGVPEDTDEPDEPDEPEDSGDTQDTSDTSDTDTGHSIQ